MAEELLSAREAARRLGIAVATLYDWLGRSDRGLLVLRGRPAPVGHLQGGPRGRGRIRVEAGEVERLKDLLRVRPRPHAPRRPPSRESFPGITVPLGRPPAPCPPAPAGPAASALLAPPLLPPSLLAGVRARA